MALEPESMGEQAPAASSIGGARLPLPGGRPASSTRPSQEPIDEAPSPATSPPSRQPPVFAIVTRGSGVERRASGSTGDRRDRQRFESRVQAPEIVEVVEDRPRYLIGYGVGHARG